MRWRRKKTRSLLELESLNNIVVDGNKVKLRNKRLADAQDDYTWQTDPELARFDAAPPLNSTFTQYLSDYASDLLYLSSVRRRFAIDTLEGKHIGNCGCYDINETKGEAELGIMIGDRNYWDKGYGTDAVVALVNHIFSQTSLKRIYLKTLDWNIRAHKCFIKCGFAPCGRMVKDRLNFTLMEIQRDQWEANQAKA